MQAFSAHFINLCFAVFGLYWFVTAFSAKPTIPEHRGRQWRFYALILLLVFVSALRRPLRMHGTALLWPHTLALGIIADVISLCGLIIVLWARTILGGNWSPNVVIKQGHELIERGPYAYVRHPIYSGALLMILALVLNDGRPFWLIGFGVVCVGLYVKARLEEKLLTKHFPEAYPKYKAKVKALIPSVL